VGNIEPANGKGNIQHVAEGATVREKRGVNRKRRLAIFSSWKVFQLCPNLPIGKIAHVLQKCNCNIYHKFIILCGHDSPVSQTMNAEKESQGFQLFGAFGSLFKALM
jgi:hypothetical protein